MSIIVTRRGHAAQKLEPISLPREGDLQAYILANPEALPMQEIGEDIRLLVVSREFETESGPIDAVALDQRGNIYIIETKLYKNPDKRTVLAQVLDYGAALWSDAEGPDGIIDRIRESALSTLGKPLLEAYQTRLGLTEDEGLQTLDVIRSNLENGAMGFVILMDRIDDRLKNLIRFVNENSRFTIYGVELEFYEFHDYEIVIPRLYGAETHKEVASRSPRRSWDEAAFFEDAALKLDSKAVKAVRRLYEFAQRTADRVSWGTGATMGSFNPKYEHIARPSLFTVYSDGRLSINFGGLRGTDVGKSAATLLSTKLIDELGFDLPPDFDASYPHFPPDLWIARADDLIRVLSDVVGQCRAR